MNITTITSLPERENTKKEINPKYNYLKHIRNSPKKVEIQDMETGKITISIMLLRDLINSQD